MLTIPSCESGLPFTPLFTIISVHAAIRIYKLRSSFSFTPFIHTLIKSPAPIPTWPLVDPSLWKEEQGICESSLSPCRFWAGRRSQHFSMLRPRSSQLWSLSLLHYVPQSARCKWADWVPHRFGTAGRGSRSQLGACLPELTSVLGSVLD